MIQYNRIIKEELTMIKKSDVVKFFESLKKEGVNLRDYSINALVFSYLMGMNPDQCVGMDLEPEFGDDQINEYYEVENIILEIRRSF